MANIGFATLQVIPSMKGLEASIAGGLAPAQGIATAQGDKAGKAFGGRFGDQFKKMLPSSFQGLNFGPLFGGAIAAGLVVGLAEVGGAVGKMRRIIAQESGATGAQLTGLFDTAKREATKVPASFDDIAAAVSELSRRGVPLGVQFDKLAEQELFLAKITKTDLAANVEATTGLFAKFNIPLKDQSREMDVLFKATQKSGKGLQELIDPLVKGGTNLQQFGFSLDQSIALVAGLSKAGVQVAPVLTSLRKAFGQIAKEGKDPQTVLRGIVKELRDGKNPTKAMADAIKLFGNRGGAELARAIQQGKFSVDGLLKSITDGKGGIIETGEATLTLGDRFTLLKNKAAIALAPLGAQVRKVFTDITTSATPVVSDLFGGIANAASGLLPILAPLGLAAAGLFKAALPILQLFADDLNTVGDALHAIPAPVLAGAAVMGVLALAALGAADGLIAAGRAAVVASLEFAATPFGAAVLVFGALVTAVTLFTRAADPAKKEAKDLGKALFNASGEAGFFARGVEDATSGVRAFLDAQIRAGNDKTLQKTLLSAGVNVTSLAAHLSDGSKEWARYRDHVSGAAGVTDKQKAKNRELGRTIDLASRSLNKQRDVFAESAKQQLRNVVSVGDLTNAQAHQLKATNRNADGTINWARVLDATDSKLKSLAEQTQRSAQQAAEANPIYSVLTNQFATGAISAEDFSKVLQEKFKFTAEQAKAAAKNLGDEIKQLAGEIDKAFPAVSDAAQGLKTNIVRASDDVAARQALLADQLKVSSAIGSGATKQMKQDISENLLHIRDDFSTLAKNKDPQKFTDNLLRQAKNISRFFSNLHILIAEGFPALARQLLDLGVEGGGQLAAGFANDKSRAKAGEAAARIVEQAKINARQQGLSDFSAYQGIGKLLPTGVAQGMEGGKPKVATAADSFSTFVRRRFSTSFYNDALTAGASIPAGVGAGIEQATPSALVKATQFVNDVKGVLHGQFRIGSPSKWARDVIGKNIVLGIAEGLDPKPLEKPLQRLTLVPKFSRQQFTPPRLTMDSTFNARSAGQVTPGGVTISFAGATIYGERHLKQVAKKAAIEGLQEATRDNGFVPGVRVAS